MTRGKARTGAASGVTGILAEVASGLRDRPELLYGFGAIVAVLALVGLASGQVLILGLALLAVVAIVLLGLAAWLVINQGTTQKASRSVRPRDGVANVTAGRIKARDADVAVAPHEVRLKAKDIDASGGARVGVAGVRDDGRGGGHGRT